MLLIICMFSTSRRAELRMGIEENQENQKDQEYLHPFRLAPKFMPATRRNCNNMAIYSEQQLLQASIISRIFFFFRSLSCSRLVAGVKVFYSILFGCRSQGGSCKVPEELLLLSLHKICKTISLAGCSVLFSGLKYISHTSPAFT